MRFNPDSTEQAVQVSFSHKSKFVDHPEIYFYGIEVKCVNEHNLLSSHRNEKISKASKGLGILKSLSFGH